MRTVALQSGTNTKRPDFAHYERFVGETLPRELDRLRKAERVTSDAVATALEDMKRFESATMDEVVVASGCLQGTTRDALYATGQSIRTFPGIGEVLGFADDISGLIEIVSCNWSTDLVRGVLDNLVGRHGRVYVSLAVRQSSHGKWARD